MSQDCIQQSRDVLVGADYDIRLPQTTLTLESGLHNDIKLPFFHDLLHEKHDVVVLLSPGISTRLQDWARWGNVSIAPTLTHGIDLTTIPG